MVDCTATVSGGQQEHTVIVQVETAKVNRKIDQDSVMKAQAEKDPHTMVKLSTTVSEQDADMRTEAIDKIRDENVSESAIRTLLMCGRHGLVLEHARSIKVTTCKLLTSTRVDSGAQIRDPWGCSRTRCRWHRRRTGDVRATGKTARSNFGGGFVSFELLVRVHLLLSVLHLALRWNQLCKHEGCDNFFLIYVFFSKALDLWILTIARIFLLCFNTARFG